MFLVEPIRDKKLVKAITEKMYKYDFKYGLIWEIGINIGLRVSDILNLPLSIKNREKITICEQKTGKKKTFPISEDLQNKIKEYIENYRVYEIPEDKHLFVGIKHCKLHRSQVYRTINEICNELEVPESVGTHTMRKTFGYHHYKQFRDVALLQTIFNHSSPAITLRYIGITQDEINTCYNKFNFDYKDTRIKKTNSLTIVPSETQTLVTIPDESITLLNQKINYLENIVLKVEDLVKTMLVLKL